MISGNPWAPREQLAQRRPIRGGAREAAALLLAEFSFSDRGLDDGRLCGSI
jgi:hypothetical protein